MKINDLQGLLLQSYKGGAYAHIKRIDDYRDCEDLIFKGLFDLMGDDCILEARAQGINPANMAARRLSEISGYVNAMIPAIYTGVVPMSLMTEHDPEHV